DRRAARAQWHGQDHLAAGCRGPRAGARRLPRDHGHGHRWRSAGDDCAIGIGICAGWPRNFRQSVRARKSRDVRAQRGEGGKAGPAVGLGAIRHFADSVLSVPACWFGFDVDRYTTARAGGRRSRQDPSTARAGEWTLERVLSLFPRLAARFQHGGQNLSGGEQQMLAIGRALVTNPRLLLIDEATEGLAPLIARDIWTTLEAICRTGVAAIIVDRDVRRLAKIASRAIVLCKGQIVFDGRPDVLLKDEALVQRYIGL